MSTHYEIQGIFRARTGADPASKGIGYWKTPNIYHSYIPLSAMGTFMYAEASSTILKVGAATTFRSWVMFNALLRKT